MHGYELLCKLNLKLIKRPVNCTVANGDLCTSLGFIQTPFTLMERTRIVDVVVVPDLAHKLLLGIDFWKAMEIVPDVQRDVWHFNSVSPDLAEMSTELSKNHTAPGLALFS